MNHCHSRSERDCGEFADSLLRENFGLGSPGGNRLCYDLRNICRGSDLSEVLSKHNTNKCQQQQRHALLSQGHQEGRWKTSWLSPKVINPLTKQNGIQKPQNETFYVSGLLWRLNTYQPTKLATTTLHSAGEPRGKGTRRIRYGHLSNLFMAFSVKKKRKFHSRGKLKR